MQIVFIVEGSEGDTQTDGRMNIVPTRVHYARILACVGLGAGLLDGEGINIGSKREDGPRMLPFDERKNTVFSTSPALDTVVVKLFFDVLGRLDFF